MPIGRIGNGSSFSSALLLPAFFSVIEGNFDLINLLYTIKSEPKAFESLSSIILSNGLFVLSWLFYNYMKG